MAVDYHYSYNHNKHEADEQQEEEDEDYIDMEVSSFSHLFSLSKTNREFEFQMSWSNNVERESTTSPADELFYKGKLLPLHLPPRLQMVEKLLQDSTTPLSKLNNSKFNHEFYSTPLGTNTCTTPLTSTPFESCQVSRELNPDEYFSDYPNNEDEQKCLISDNPKKSWTKKIKTKIKSLFAKSGSFDESSVSSANQNKDEGEKQIKETQKTPFGQILREDNIKGKEGKICHRRSFSGAFKRRSLTTKLSPSISSGYCSSSSSSSSSSSNSNGLNALKRSNSAKSEMENSLIQGAIAHCKESQKILSEVGCHSLSSSRFAAFDDQTRLTGICRG